MALVADFRMEAHCCNSIDSREGGFVELTCTVCKAEPITVWAGDPAGVFDAIAEHEHEKEESSRPCHRRIARREKRMF